MRFSALLATAGVVSILFGALFLLAPATGLVQYGVSTDATGLFMSQFFGAALLQMGLILFLARRVQEPATIRAIALGGMVGEIMGLSVAVRIQMAGMVNSFGWSTVLIYGLFALAFARFAFGGPVTAEGAQAG